MEEREIKEKWKKNFGFSDRIQKLFLALTDANVQQNNVQTERKNMAQSI